MGRPVPNAPNGLFELIGTQIPVGPTFLAGAVTQITRANPGNDFQVDISASAGSAAGQLLFDSSVATGSYCWVDSIAVGVATCTAPISGTNLTTVFNSYTDGASNGSSWAIGNTLRLFTVPTIYMDVLAPNVGSLTAIGGANTSGVSWISNLNFGDASGTPGNSMMTVRSIGGFITMTMVRSDAFFIWDALDQPGLSVAQPQISEGWFDGGAQFVGFVFLNACSVGTNTAFIPVFVDGVEPRVDTILHNGVVIVGVNQVVNMHVTNGTLLVEPASALQVRTPAFNGAVWGATTIRLLQGAVMDNRTGGTWANNVIVAGMQLTSAALTTGTVPAVGGTFTNNGVTQVDTAATCAGGTTAPCFPIGAPITWSLATVGGTPCLAGGP